MKGLFIHMRKTSGIFLTSYFAAACYFKIIISGHQAISGPLKANDIVGTTCPNGYEVGNLNQYFKFTFVRNPFDWHVSNACAEEARRGIITKEIFRRRILNKKENKRFWLSDEYKEMCFDKEKKKSLLDKVYKFEERENAVKDIFNHLNIIPEISYQEFLKQAKDEILNVSDHTHYSDYYDEELIELVSEKEKEIINEFGYKYEI